MHKHNRAVARGVWVLLWMLMPLLLPAQTPTSGTIVGTVRDPSGAIVPGAAIQLLDLASNSTRTAVTNDVGQYAFPNLIPGEYQIKIEAAGFRTAISTIKVEVAKSSLGDFTLQVGQMSDTVEVLATATELQTLDAAVGDVVGGSSLLALPTIQRRASELMYLQVGAQPVTGADGYGRGGGVAGARSDQNVFTIDGIDISEPEMGGTVRQIGPGMAVPVDAIEEFRGTVTNANASYGRSGGGQFAFSTRRGTNDLHGAAYWYHQNDNVNSNSWTRNRLQQANPELKDNRYGARLGGPIIRDKTFLFAFYEGRRFPQSTDVSRLVPTDSFRNGLLRFRDGAGNIVSYNLKTSTACGAGGDLPCDPRGIGMSPVISALMAQYPIGNSPSDGDGLNTVGFRGATDTSQKNEYVLMRLDHQLTSQWQFYATYNWQQERYLTSNMLEIDPALTQGKQFLTLSGYPADPRNYSVALLGTLRPNLLNEFHMGWTQTGVPLKRSLPRIQVAAAEAPLRLAPSFLNSPGDPLQSLSPQFSRSRVWSWVDNLSWIKGTHNFSTGINLQRLNFTHTRFDKSGIVTTPVASLYAGSFVAIPGTQRPPTCSGSAANCLRSSDQSRWNDLYSAMLGIVDNNTGFVPRDASGAPQSNVPLGNNVFWWHMDVHASDTWRLRPSLTLNLGVNFLVETPVRDELDRQGFVVDLATSKPINPINFLDQRRAAAEQGKTYDLSLGFLPINKVDQDIYSMQKKVGPRLGVAWQPSFGSGLLGRLFGNGKTVFRGGYSLVFDRVNVVNPVEYPLGGNEFLGTTVTVQGPKNTAGLPLRVGVDGPVPAPVVPPTVPIPYIPSSRNPATGAPFGVLGGAAFDPDYTIGSTHGLNFTIQREIRAGTVVETGWIGRYGRDLPTRIDINYVPYFIKDMSGQSQQTFAQAFDAVATQLRNGQAAASVTPQPWFENNLGAGGTIALAGAASSNFITADPQTLFINQIDPRLMNRGSKPVLNQQFQQLRFSTSTGWSNYDAFFLSLRQRFARGLSFNLNWTWAHMLDPGGTVQDSAGGQLTDPYNPNYDYAESNYDRRHSLSVFGTYQLPFQKSNRILGGWTTSFIFTAYSGQPLIVTSGAPIAVIDYDQGRYLGIAGSGGVGTSGDPAKGGTGVNMFSDPEQVFKNFRYRLFSQDDRTSRGIIRSLGMWNLDLSIAKDVKITEQLNFKFTLDMFNSFNHVLAGNGGLSLTNPAAWGVITSEKGNTGPRRMQFGLRFEF